MDWEKKIREAKGNAFAILQLGESEAAVYARFESLEGLKKLGNSPQRELYDVVYAAPLAPYGNLHEMLEGIFARFNMDRPEDFTGRSLSVSDVVALKEGGRFTHYYVDSVGFKQLDWAGNPAPERGEVTA